MDFSIIIIIKSTSLYYYHILLLLLSYLLTIIITTIIIIGVVIHCYWSKVQCASTGHTITDSSYLQSILPGSDISSSDVFYSSVYLINLLLLSGDVELNPGPLTGKHVLVIYAPIN